MNSYTIVIADDHEVFKKGLQFYLHGHFTTANILTVSNSETLIKTVIKNKVDLIITDIDMEGRGGLYGLEHIKKIEPAIPVLVLSWYEEEVYGVRAIRSGASAYLCKTALPEEIMLAVTTLLSGKKYFTENMRELLLEDPTGEPLAMLSNQEFEVFKLTVLGFDTSRVAERLVLAVTTVKSTRNKILRLLRLNSVADLTRLAMSKKLVRNV